MTVKPIKFLVNRPVVVEGHEVGEGVYVGQKITNTETERSMKRAASYFLHLTAPRVGDDEASVRRFDLEVSELVAKGEIKVN